MTSRRKAIGSDAQAAMHDLQEQKRRRHMTEAEKKEAARVRAYYDIPQTVKDGIIAVAGGEGLTASAVASVFLADALRRYRQQKLSFAGIKRHSSSPRWDYTVEDWEILTVLKGPETASEDAEK